jgi:hypothetical protein
MNAPGASTKIIIPSASPMNLYPNIEPLPNSSLIKPKVVNPKVKPNPIPIPSNIESIGVLRLANASALPRIKQFTTMSGMNNPRLSYNEGRYACMQSCNKVTKEAIMTMNAGIRTLSGTTFFSKEMTAFEQIKTKVVHKPIPIPFMADVVVPKVGHIPSKRQNTGFSLMIPFITILNLFIAVSFFIVLDT